MCKAWEKRITSESFREKGQSVFKEEISEDEYKLWNMAIENNAKEVMALLCSGMVGCELCSGISRVNTLVSGSKAWPQTCCESAP